MAVPPTTVQRKTLAKMGVAMPDGSYYIRNQAELEDAIHAVGRATPNAGESDVARRNAVRQHCIARAKALNLTKLIPDTWNSDGSLKQSATAEDVLAQFGVKGMHWGGHKSGSGPGPGQGRLANLNPDQQKFQISRLSARLAELEKARAAANAAKPGSWHGDNEITRVRARLAAVQQQQKVWEAQKSQKKVPLEVGSKVKTLKPVGNGSKVRLLEPVKHDEISTVEELLEHFGVKGMHWGVRTSGSGSSSTPSADRSEANRLAAKVKAAGGTHVLSNHELKKLNERLNLEANHNRLLHPGNQESGRQTVEKILKEAGKQEAKKYATIYAAKGAEFAAKWVVKQALGTSGGKGRHG